MSLCRVVEYDPNNFEPWYQALDSLKRRWPTADPERTRIVGSILADIEERGIEAVLESARTYDCSSLEFDSIAVTDEEYERASVSPKHLEAIRHSIERVTHFHEAQLAALTKGWSREPTPWTSTDAYRWQIPARSGAHPTGYEGQRLVHHADAGIYVPGGKAAYPSSVIMNAIPARVAGIGASEISICTPAGPNGKISPAVIVAAREIGIRRIVKVGGAAAIGFLALGEGGDGGHGPGWRFQGVWGPNSVVAGPGNAWVNEAKRQLWGRVGLDSYAGPSEVCVLTDGSANARFAAADWLTQVEHAEDNVGVVVSTSRSTAMEILEEAEKQLAGAPREAIMRKALSEHGLVLICDGDHIEAAASAACKMRAEHLTIMVEDLDDVSSRILSAGCVLLGDYTPQSSGDFVSGPSHTLPTNLGARFASPVNVMTFLKFQNISCLTKEDLAELRPTIEAFAEMEGFPQHGLGASIRFEE